MKLRTFVYGLAGLVLELAAIIVLVALMLHGFIIGEKTSIFTGIVNATVWAPVSLAVSAMIYELADTLKRKANFPGLFGLLNNRG
nr:MAG TPA: hypothetical protein [Caudoviricetes sp.]